MSPSILLRRIFERASSVLYVIHNMDGGWQFLDGNNCEPDDAMTVALEEAIKHDPTLVEVAALPHGFFAVRDSVDGPWQVGYGGSDDDSE